MHGDIRGDRYEIVRQFREEALYNVLLSSEIGSEGIDLQFASIVVNDDMPWNPMRIEQRRGRVDHMGQQKDKMLVLNLIYRDTIDEDINERLHCRLQIFHRALSMSEIILGQEVRELAARLLDPSLTRSQRRQIIDRSALAIENRRLEEETLEREATGLIAHGDFVLKRIRESRERGGWIGEEDIRDDVAEALPRLFPGSRVEAEAPGSDLYRIELDGAASTALREFLRRQGRFQPTGLLDGDGRRRYRFTPRGHASRGTDREQLAAPSAGPSPSGGRTRAWERLGASRRRGASPESRRVAFARPLRAGLAAGPYRCRTGACRFRQDPLEWRRGRHRRVPRPS